MITHDQILPSLLQLQRMGLVGKISVVAQHRSTVRRLKIARIFEEAFPGQSFDTFPIGTDEPQPDKFREVIASMEPNNIVVAAVPDQLHYDVVMTALQHNQHVCCVKPLVLNVQDSMKIEAASKQRGLFVGIEYHKRFDDRSLMARRKYREGLFGHFRLGTAALMEKWYYRNSNFQNWFSTENSDAFTYIGCHYVDLVHFITGLLPVSVSVYGLTDRFPNGTEGYLWTDARIVWNNGACLNVQNSLSFPDAAPGTNTQSLTMHCSVLDRAGLLQHSDQYRGLQYCYTEKPDSPGATQYAEPSPDYFQYVPLGGPGLTPVGYGYRSIEHIIRACTRVASKESVEDRRAVMQEIESEAIIATPANSRYNELVMQAGRLSILNHAREAVIAYGETPAVKLR